MLFEKYYTKKKKREKFLKIKYFSIQVNSYLQNMVYFSNI